VTHEVAYSTKEIHNSIYETEPKHLDGNKCALAIYYLLGLLIYSIPYMTATTNLPFFTIPNCHSNDAKSYTQPESLPELIKG
jgi:hypothetical protein